MIDLTGKRFGRLIVLKLTGKDKWGHYRWLCQCDCGQYTVVRGNHLKNGHTKSCGCLHKEIVIKIKTKHGHRTRTKTTAIYCVWTDMIQRCANPNHKHYKNYGGRGITVCNRWRYSFSNFLEDMGECPPGLTLERRNNNKGYSPSNCYWATWKQQQRNRRNNRPITHNGKTQLLIEWAEETGIDRKTITARLKRGWSTERALKTPVRKCKRRNQMDELAMKTIATNVAEVFESLTDVNAEDFKEVKRLSQKTVGLRETGAFNVGVRMLRRKDIREQHAKLMAAIAAEKWGEGFLMALQLMAAFGV